VGADGEPVGADGETVVGVRAAGRTALLVEVRPDQVARWYAALASLRQEGLVRDVVPAARTVLLDGVLDPVAVRAHVLAMSPPPLPDTEGPLVELAVHYDGEDLAEVARLWGTDEAGVVAVHTGTAFRVAFCGFAPGFGYLSGLPPHRHVPRRATPRTRVRAGSVGLADEWSGVYPTASPGGWQLIGRTTAPLFDVHRDPPALLAPGTRVRFVDAGRDVGTRA